jgi:hypothetical protein
LVVQRKRTRRASQKSRRKIVRAAKSDTSVYVKISIVLIRRSAKRLNSDALSDAHSGSACHPKSAINYATI